MNVVSLQFYKKKVKKNIFQDNAKQATSSVFKQKKEGNFSSYERNIFALIVGVVPHGKGKGRI